MARNGGEGGRSKHAHNVQEDLQRSPADHHTRRATAAAAASLTTTKITTTRTTTAHTHTEHSKKKKTRQFYTVVCTLTKLCST